jgi:hypothetical protein
MGYLNLRPILYIVLVALGVTALLGLVIHNIRSVFVELLAVFPRLRFHSPFERRKGTATLKYYFVITTSTYASVIIEPK